MSDYYLLDEYHSPRLTFKDFNDLNILRAYYFSTTIINLLGCCGKPMVKLFETSISDNENILGIKIKISDYATPVYRIEQDFKSQDFISFFRTHFELDDDFNIVSVIDIFEGFLIESKEFLVANNEDGKFDYIIKSILKQELNEIDWNLPDNIKFLDFYKEFIETCNCLMYTMCTDDVFETSMKVVFSKVSKENIDSYIYDNVYVENGKVKYK